MQITAIDESNNLYQISNVLPQLTVDHIMATPWQELPWSLQSGQEVWARRKVDNSALPWFAEFEQHLSAAWPLIAQSIGRKLGPYQGTAWWLDQEGFTCPLHTDGEMPGALHLTWIGALSTLGTAFYHYKDSSTLRYQVPMQVNAGYIMVNSPNSNQYRQLQWHGMLTPVPKGTFRLTSYSWLTEKQ